MELQQFITEYGYLAILIGTFLEGETIVILSGIAAQLGYLEPTLVILSAFSGSFCGDQFYFLLGRRFGPRIINRRLSWQEGAEKVYRILQRHQDFLILSFRFGLDHPSGQGAGFWSARFSVREVARAG